MAVVDIGGGVTDVAVYYRGVPRYVATIPMGASAINRDIRSQSIPEKHVESLKCKYGSAVAELAPEDKLIRVSGRTAREAKDILLRNLATVIEAGLPTSSNSCSRRSGIPGYAERLAYGIVLTGGSARLKDIDELFRRVTGMDVRIASAETGISEDSREAVANPAFATVVGLLLKGAGMGSCNVIEDKAGLSPRRPVPPTSVPGFQPPQPQSRPQPQPYAPTRPSAETVNAAYARREAARAESAAAEPRRTDARRGARASGSVQEPVKKERNWRSIFKRTLDKINEGFNAADDEEI